MKYWKSFLSFLFFGMLIAPIPGINDVVQAFTEPLKPTVDTPLDPVKEAKINEVVVLPTEDAFQRLQGIDFIVDEKLMERAIFERFSGNIKEATNLVLSVLGHPVVEETSDGQIVDWSRSFYVARKILQVFPSEIWPDLRTRFNDANPVVRGNIILLSGRVAAGATVTKLLVNALSDKDVYGEENELMEGTPLRVCDLAYNQLVLRFKIPNVLRSIGTIHAIEDRDLHIDKLKSVLIN